MKKINIGILTFPINEAGNVPLSNLIEILKPLAIDLYLITGNDGSAFFKRDKRIHTYSVKHEPKKYVFIRILNYICTQLKISYQLVKLSKKTRLWIFFIGGDTLLLPMLTTKLLRKGAILASAGSSLQCSRLKDPNLTKPIEILEHINRSLSNQIVIYSTNLIKEWRMEKYKSKISIAHEHFLDFKKFEINNEFYKRKNLIGYIGALSEEKGILEFIESIPKIMDIRNDLYFFIGGDGRLRGDVEKYLSEKDLKHKVEFRGWIFHNEVPGHLNRLILLVLPSYTEGLPNIILEAMACGTPVLATPVGTIPDIIADGKTGFLMENNSPECIAANVIRALEHPDLKGIAKRARTMVEREFTFEKAVERWKKVLE